MVWANVLLSLSNENTFLVFSFIVHVSIHYTFVCFLENRKYVVIIQNEGKFVHENNGIIRKGGNRQNVFFAHMQYIHTL